MFLVMFLLGPLLPQTSRSWPAGLELLEERRRAIAWRPRLSHGRQFARQDISALACPNGRGLPPLSAQAEAASALCAARDHASCHAPALDWVHTGIRFWPSLLLRNSAPDYLLDCVADGASGALETSALARLTANMIFETFISLSLKYCLLFFG
jgi:hypothetical protein